MLSCESGQTFPLVTAEPTGHHVFNSSLRHLRSHSVQAFLGFRLCHSQQENDNRLDRLDKSSCPTDSLMGCSNMVTDRVEHTVQSRLTETCHLEHGCHFFFSSSSLTVFLWCLLPPEIEGDTGGG